MLVSIAEHIGAPIGATQTTTLPAVSFAVTIQRTSGSATTASGGTTASLTNRGGQSNCAVAAIIAFALIVLLGLCLALAARKIVRELYDRYHAPPPPMLDLNRLEDLRY